MKVTLRLGDCLEWLELTASNSVDSIVTDPPYGLSFMGKHWDSDVPPVDIWAECLRVLKPGGHLLSFFGTRTYHRGVTRIEDAGFEIRDQIAWTYGSGFPKSMNVANAINDVALGQPQGGAKPNSSNHGKFKGGCSDENPRGRGFGAGPGNFMAESGGKIDRELVQSALQWEGWGTALKPAFEPIVVARKPLIGTVVANVLTHGTGGLNINGCRVESGMRPLREIDAKTTNNNTYIGRLDGGSLAGGSKAVGETSIGRWPANLIHDGSDEVLTAFPSAPGQLADASNCAPSAKNANVYGAMKRTGEPSQNSDNVGTVGFKMKPGARRTCSGSAARFFYCAKASKSDRGFMNNHPTVKPTDLMRYLCRLVTPPGGTVLDPFMGSGSTGKAAWLEGFNFIGIELDPAYMAIAKRRINELVLDL